MIFEKSVEALACFPHARLVLIIDQTMQMCPFRHQIEDLVSAVTSPGVSFDVGVFGSDFRDRAHWALSSMNADPTCTRNIEDTRPVVCLLVTDALGDVLIDGTITELLRSFPPGSRTALVHPWPPRVWQRSRLGRLCPVAAGNSALSDSVLPVVELSPEGIASLERWTRASDLGDLYAVHLPSEADAVISGRRALSWEQRVRAMSVFLEPDAMEALLVAAVVPGNVDMRLLRLLSAAVGSHGGVSAHGLALVLSSGFLRPAPDSRNVEPVFCFVENAARTALLSLVPASVVRDVNSVLERENRDSRRVSLSRV